MLKIFFKFPNPLIVNSNLNSSDNCFNCKEIFSNLKLQSFGTTTFGEVSTVDFSDPIDLLFFSEEANAILGDELGWIEVLLELEFWSSSIKSLIGTLEGIGVEVERWGNVAKN